MTAVRPATPADLAGAAAIYAVSKRAPVSSSNVNQSADVTINPDKVGTTA